LGLVEDGTRRGDVVLYDMVGDLRRCRPQSLLHRLRSQGLFCIGKTIWLVAEKGRHNKHWGLHSVVDI
jgi:hypothetical protein